MDISCEILKPETKIVVFDLDGTLTDSGEGIINCASLALEHFGLPVPSREEMRVFVGPPLDQTFIKFGVPADKTDEAIRVYRSRYTTVGKFENFPYPGIRELLETLQANGHKLYVATSKPEGMSVDILNHFDQKTYRGSKTYTYNVLQNIAAVKGKSKGKQTDC